LSARAVLGADTGSYEQRRCFTGYICRMPDARIVDGVFTRTQLQRPRRPIRQLLMKRHGTRQAKYDLGSMMNRVHCELRSFQLKLRAAAMPRLFSGRRRIR